MVTEDKYLNLPQNENPLFNEMYDDESCLNKMETNALCVLWYNTDIGRLN